MDDINNDQIANLLVNLAEDNKVLARAQAALEQKRRTMAFRKRRSRNQLLIELGGLFVIAGLMATDLNVVLGALVQAGSVQDEKGKRQAWAQLGHQAFAGWLKAGRTPLQPDPASIEPGVSPAAAQKCLARKLIIRGAVVEKAGLDDWPAATILGILLVIARSPGDKARVESWKRKGAAFSAASRPPLHPYIVVAFKGRIPRPAAAQLRGLKLKPQRKKRWFVGRADPAAAHAIAKPVGGEVHVLKPGKRPPW